MFEEKESSDAMVLLVVVLVVIRPQINHMKLNEHTRRLLFIAKRAYRTL
jgi:hypothetical protein